MWLLAGAIGLLVSVAAIAFREVIGLVQLLWLGDRSENVASAAREIHWLWILLTPCIGGLFVGWMLERFLPSRRTASVADAMEACARGGRNIEMAPGLTSAFISAVSLGVGASAGREGPVVHLGATISTSIAHLFAMPEWGRRTLLACGVASAVSASFNAPIAGVLFAHEVILGHYSKRSFVPIVISSVAGTILTRQWFGNDAAFVIPDYSITSYLEFPAFALLGIICAMVALLFQYSVNSADFIARQIVMPLWLRPAVGGLAIGAIGVFYPEILGVGYEATSQALNNQLPLTLLFMLLILKTAATAITLASRFGGGVFSPSLYLGAMAGGAFGLIAAGAFPELASSQGIYSILGMGAVAAAVLGAPISTVVMVFELTGGYALSIALLLCVSISSGINQALIGRSYFQRQLEQRGVQIEDGPHKFLIQTTRVSSFMVDLAEDDDPYIDPESDTPVLNPETPLEQALRAFDESGHSRLPVASKKDETIQIGWATQVGALRKFNSILVDTSVEEHR
ncbi:chloride channel protein [Pseudahrensia aquimaris]